MKHMLRVGIMLGVLAGIASSQPPQRQPPQRPWRPLSEDDFRPVEPASGIAKVALPDRVLWCTAPFTGEKWDGMHIASAVLGRPRGDDFGPGLWQLCQAPEARPNRLAVEYALQSIMNDNGIDQEKAEAFVAKKLGLTSIRKP